MVGSAGRPAQIKSVVATNFDNLNKKRKLQDELPGMPSPKLICWDHKLSSSESSTNPNRINNDKFARGGGSEFESSKYSNCSTDSIMSTDDEAKTNPRYQELRNSDNPPTSSLSWGGTSSSEIDLYSSETQSMTKSGSTETEMESISSSEQQHDCPYHQLLSSNPHFLEFGGFADCYCSEYKNHAIDNELNEILYSNGVDANNFVLSSGRWSVNQDAGAEQGGEKLTIDKEFEQYFSMLML